MSRLGLSCHEVKELYGVKLKPCPFCGSERLVLSARYALFVGCKTCGAEGPDVRFDRCDPGVEAVRRWNHREKREG